VVVADEQTPDRRQLERWTASPVVASVRASPSRGELGAGKIRFARAMVCVHTRVRCDRKHDPLSESLDATNRRGGGGAGSLGRTISLRSATRCIAYATFRPSYPVVDDVARQRGRTGAKHGPM